MSEQNGNGKLEKQLGEVIALLRQIAESSSQPKRRLLRLKEAAFFLHIGANQLRALIQKGEIPVVRQHEGSGAPWLVDVQDLAQWIERSKS
jgi:hypothetical protein